MFGKAGRQPSRGSRAGRTCPDIRSARLARGVIDPARRSDSCTPHQRAETRSGRRSGPTLPETAAPALHARPHQRTAPAFSALPQRHSRACFTTARQWRGCGTCGAPAPATGGGAPQGPTPPRTSAAGHNRAACSRELRSPTVKALDGEKAPARRFLSCAGSGQRADDPLYRLPISVAGEGRTRHAPGSGLPRRTPSTPLHAVFPFHSLLNVFALYRGAPCLRARPKTDCHASAAAQQSFECRAARQNVRNDEEMRP